MYPERSVSNAIKRIILHTLVYAIGFGIVYLLGGLTIEILEELFSFNLATLKHTTIFMCSAAIPVSVLAGAAGPIATYDYAKEDSYKIVRARPKPLYFGCIFFVLLSVAAFALYMIFRAKHQVQPDVPVTDETAILSLALSLAATIYSVLFTGASLLHIRAATCKKCGFVSCRIKVGESDHTTSVTTQTRKRTYAGPTYDVYDSSGTHIGTAVGSDSTRTEHRTVYTETWNEHFSCVHCKQRSSGRASRTKKGEWS